MIPKTIHYCWFGRNPMPELAMKCIESWKIHCPDYEIVEWNEDNFDIASNLYVKQAYEAKKYAFVTDYVRLYALFTQGGIYMDTDVMVLKPLDPFLSHKAFSGFESREKISTGIMAAEKGMPLVKELLGYYEDAVFIKEDGSLDTTTNVEIITRMLLPLGFQPDGLYQEVAGFALYPQNVFCPEHKRLKDPTYMKETAAIHYFAGSWKSEREKRREKSLWWRLCVPPAMVLSKAMKGLFGEAWTKWKENTFRFLYQHKE